MGRITEGLAFGSGAYIGAAVTARLADRRARKGPGMILTMVHVLISLSTLLFIPLLGAVWVTYASARLARRIGQVDYYDWTNGEYLQLAFKNKTAWILGPLLVLAAIVQLSPSGPGTGLQNGPLIVVVLLLGFGAIGAAIWNGVSMNRGLRDAIAAGELA